MSRASMGYISMTLIAGAMLWGIVHVGRGLKAPTDFSGQWEIASSSTPGRRMMIQQSGVYLHIHFDGKTERYKLQVGGGYTFHGDQRSWQARLNGRELSLIDPAAQETLTLRRLPRDAS